MRILTIFFLLLASPSLLTMNNNKKNKKNHIIFDLDDILFCPDPTGGYLPKSLTNLAKSFTIESTEKKLVELIKPLDNDIPKEEEKPEKLAVFRNSDLPIIWCLYLMNKRTSENLITLIKQQCDTTYNKFNPKKQIISYAIETAFTPEKEANILTPKKEIIELVKKLNDQENNKLYILANKRAETLNILQEKHPTIFKLFENQIHISGQTKKLKPNVDAYTYFLNSYNLDPKNCYIIENLPQYLNAAEEQKINPIAYNNNLENLEKQLKEMQLLKNE